MIGIECHLDELPKNIIGKLLENIDIEKYTWDLSYVDIAIPEMDEYIHFREKGLRSFIDHYKDDQIIFLVLKGYASSDHPDVDNPKEFVNSNCEIVLIICDAYYIDLYFKNENSSTFLDNLKRLNIKYDIKTLENDQRYTFNVF